MNTEKCIQMGALNLLMFIDVRMINIISTALVYKESGKLFKFLIREFEYYEK